jgi:hypothetical protein
LTFKLTIAAQVLVLLRTVAALGAKGRGDERRSGPHRLRTIALLAYPVLLFVGLSAGRHQAHIGFLLPAFPFVMLWIGAGLGDLERLLGAAARPLVSALLIVGAVEAFSVHPHYLMFFNRWAGGPEGGPRYLVHRDDWGQDKRRLGEWQRAHGVERLFYAGYGGNAANWGIVADPVPCQPTEGVFALHAVEVHRPVYTLAPGCVDWLTIEPPDERLGYTIYIYRVDAVRLARLRAERGTRTPFWRSAPPDTTGGP